MQNITIISSSVRVGRKSHRVALYLKNFAQENYKANVTLVDLATYNFPIFEERLKFIKDPTKEMLALSETIKSSNAIVIVTPEYNGSFPASLKNVLDLYYDEWYHKPVAVATVSNGSFGGVNTFASLLFTLFKLRTYVVPANFPVPTIEKQFDENGNAFDKEATDKRAANFFKEIFYLSEK